MKAVCLQENLTRMLSIANRAVAPRNATLPILTHVLLATDNGHLRISATNLELSISCQVSAKVEKEGAITVPARVFSELVALLPADQINLELDERTQTLHVHSVHSNTRLKGCDPQEFPSIATTGNTTAALLNSSALKKLIHQVSFAASTDEARPNITGVFTKVENQQITMVATDGYRLSLRKETLQSPSPLESPLEMVIPARALNEVARVLSDQDKERPVTISITHPRMQQVLFHTENVDVTIQLIDQKFPPYNTVIPQNWETRAVLNTADFIKACRQANIFARHSKDMVRITVKSPDHLTTGRVVVNAQAAENGENITELEAEVTGPDLEIGFNVRFLLEALAVIDTQQVALEMIAPNKPAVLRAVGDEQFLYVIMPMQLPSPSSSQR